MLRSFGLPDIAFLINFHKEIVKLFIKLLGVVVGVLALIVFVAFISMQGASPETNLSIELPGETRENTPVASTNTPPSPSPVESAPVAAPLKKQNPTTVASSSISTPGALIVPQKTSPSGGTPTQSVSIPGKVGALNQQDIILLTNSERIAAGLPPLAFNATLAAIAEAKAKDMIAKQYFAHVSPTGTTITDLALEYNYQYRNIGENLALGDFEDSKDVVNGWMNSPGHRANILNTDFTEIGVAAIMGNYNGRSVWYSVQEFGRPMPKCPMPDTALEQKITLYQSQITMTETTLLHLKEEIESPNTDEETYRAKVKDYNTIVRLYNDLVEAVKSYISAYNAEVGVYNACVSRG